MELCLIRKVCEESSSSSTSEEDSETEELYILFSKQRKKHTKNKNFVKNVISKYCEDDFKMHFRLTRTDVENLCTTLKCGKITIIGRPPIPFLDCLLLTIWLLANQESFRSVADRFGVGRGTCHKIFIKTCQIICSKVDMYVKWPIGNEAIETVNHFEALRGNRSFPNVIGCVDGTHIAIPGPLADNSYYNRKGFHSMLLQGICNSKQEFIDIYFGWPGSVNDARMWQNSPIYNKLKNQNILPPNAYLLGDSAYPLDKFIMVPFRDNGHLSRMQHLFNQRLSSTRVVIEQSFGRLKSMFRRLKYLHVLNLKYCKYIVFAACILHNICLQDEDEVLQYSFHSSDNDQEYQDDSEIEINQNPEASQIRNFLMNEMFR